MARSSYTLVEKAAAAAILLSAAIVAKMCPQAAAPARYINADTSVMMPLLTTLADTATQEYGKCLLGGTYESNGDTLYVIDAAVEPLFVGRPADRPKNGITFVCHQYGLIGTWHNHVLSEYLKLPEGPWSWPDAPTKAAEACQLSQGDLMTAMKPLAPPIVAIGVNKATFCWFFKADLLKRFGNGPYPLAVRPDSNHLRTDWPKP